MWPSHPIPSHLSHKQPLPIHPPQRSSNPLTYPYPVAGLEPLRKLAAAPTDDDDNGEGNEQALPLLSEAEAAALAQSLAGLEGVMTALDVPGQVSQPVS